jgi:hypothetical protein
MFHKIKVSKGNMDINSEFEAEFESVEKVAKKLMRKSSQPFNFFDIKFFATFSTDSNSASNSAFLILISK